MFCKDGAASPKSHLGGEHAGVKLDIDVELYKPESYGTFFANGPFEGLQDESKTSADGIVHTRCSGIVEVDGKVLRFKDGWGVHERILQRYTIPDRTGFMSGRGLWWIHGFSEDFTWFLKRGDIGKGTSVAMINIDNKQIVLKDPSSSGVEEIANWVDPLTRILSPYKWRVWVRIDQGTLETHIHAYQRAYYTWVRRGGILVVSQYCADAETTFTYPDGTVKLALQMISIEHMRTLYRQLSSLN